jgi:glycosyltransferase involved in cell wall biosynthesis
MRVCQFSATEMNTHFFEHLGRGLDAAGMEPLFVTLGSAPPPAWLNQLPAVEYRYLNATNRLHYPQAVLKLARILKREKISVLHAHLFDAGIVGLFAARLAGVPIRIIGRHHLDEHRLLGARWHVGLDQWMARRADYVVVPSNAVRQYMVECESLTESGIEVIPHGFDFTRLAAGAEERQRVRREFGLSDSFVLGCVGRFFGNKGHRYLFQAVNALAAEIPDLRVLLLGDGDRALIEGLINEWALQDRVVFAGYRRDVAACMKAMDLLVHPSLSESFGQVLVEAMAVGTPVIATNVGGVPEIVTHDETGLLVPSHNAVALASAIRRLYVDPQRRAQLAQAGQQSVRKRFVAENMIQGYVEVYRRCERDLSVNGKSYVRAEV